METAMETDLNTKPPGTRIKAESCDKTELLARAKNKPALSQALNNCEQQRIEECLRRNNGSRIKTAVELSIKHGHSMAENEKISNKFILKTRRHVKQQNRTLKV